MNKFAVTATLTLLIVVTRAAKDTENPRTETKQPGIESSWNVWVCLAVVTGIGVAILLLKWALVKIYAKVKAIKPRLSNYFRSKTTSVKIEPEVITL